MKKRIISFSINLIAVLVIVFLYFHFIFNPSHTMLKTKIKNEFINNMTIKSILFDNTISRYIEGAKSITSRSMIRNKIEEFHNGKMSIDELIKFTLPKYIDGISALKNCIYAIRYVNGIPVAECRKADDTNLDYIISDTAKHKLTNGFYINDSTSLVYIISPIIHRKSILGYDIIYFTNSLILQQIKDDNIDFEIFPKFKGNYISHKGKELYQSSDDLLLTHDDKILYQVKSKYTDAFFVFSISEDELFKELQNFYYTQTSVLILLIIAIILFLILIQRRAKFIFSKQNKYLTELVSQKTNTLNNIIKELETAKGKTEESEAKFKKLSNLTFEGILIHEKGITIEINLSLAKMFGYTREEILGQNIIKLVVLEKYHAIVSENILKNHVLPYEIEARKKDGALIPIEIESRNLVYNNQKIRVSAIRNITDRKKADYEIKKLSTAVEQSANTIVITDTFGKIEYTNPKFTELTGYTAEEALGKNPNILNAGTQSETYYKEMWQAISVGNTWKGEFHNKTKSGNFFWEQVTITPIKDDDGKITNYLAIKENITARKIAEQALKENQQLLKEAQKISHLGHWELDLVNNKLIWSDEIYCILGLIPQEFSATYEAFLENIHPDDREKVNEAYDNSLKTKKPYEIEHRLLLKNGELKHVIEKCKTEYDKNGNPARSIGTVLDITERKKAIEELKESESYNKALFHRSHTPLVVMDMNTYEFIDCNEAAINIYKYKNKEDVLGKTPLDVSAQVQYNGELSSTAAKDKINLALKNGFVLFEWKHQRPNGEIWDAEVHLMSITHKNKKILQFSLLDITDRKKAELALKESETRLRENNKTKDKFFSIIAHDLKSPFNSMLGFSELLVSNFDKIDNQRKKIYIDNIYQSTHNTYRLLENLLLWSRSQSGVIEFYPRDENLFLLTTETINILSQSASNKSITINNEISEDILVKADKNMLSTVLRNLISNAIKFTHKNGDIVINARTTTNINNQIYTEISVKDNGIGIEPEIQKNLFKITESISIKGTEDETGTGLGLILCKEFVVKHGGKIWGESEIGKGSTFIFTIPQA